MKDKINTYFAILLVTLAGAGATLLIVHIGTTDVIATAFASNEANYSSLQQSILKN